MTDEPIVVRDAREGDLGFARDTWFESFLARFRKRVTTDVAAALRTATVRIACDRQDEDTLAGFAAHKGDELLYVYVKQPVRGQGIARRLLEGLDLKSYAYRTVQGEQLLESLGLKHGMTYRPRIIL